MRRYTRVLFLLIPAVSALAMGADASGSTVGGPDSPPRDHEVLDYWTQERMIGASSVNAVLEDVDGLLSELTEPLLPAKQKREFSDTTDGEPWPAGGQVSTAVGRIFFTFGGRDRVCTGTVVQDFRNAESMVLTAGHCVYDSRSGEFAENWIFIPGFERAPFAECDSQPLGCWTADNFVTSREFANGNLEGDYGFAVIGRRGKGGNGLLENLVTPQTVAFEREGNEQVYAFGYPRSGDYDGNDLIYCAGITVADDWANTSNRGVRCNMNDGASGGPWITDFDQDTCSGVVTSVTSYRYAAGHLHEYLFGPDFGVEARRAYVEAQSATANAIVD